MGGLSVENGCGQIKNKATKSAALCGADNSRPEQKVNVYVSKKGSKMEKIKQRRLNSTSRQISGESD